MKKKRWLSIWLCAIGVYLVAVLLLLMAERQTPDASIQSFGDALWYSFVTISTVGYGDLYPITGAGKLMGIVFVALSVGLLSFVISAMVSLMTGTLLPAIRMWVLRDRSWYIFSCLNPYATALADDLAAQDPDAVFLFPVGSQGELPTGGTCLYYPRTIEQTAARKKRNCRIFFLEETSDDTFTRAVEAQKLGLPVYCMTKHAPDVCPEGLTLFDPSSSCGRAYWQQYGLGPDESVLVLIGSGADAQQLLECSLLTNLYPPEHPIHYHVFGQWEDFRRNHFRLDATLCIDSEAPGQDSLYFHEEPWNDNGTLLRDAARIILCDADPAQNLAILRTLRQCFPTKAAIHLRSSVAIPGEKVFGTNQEIFTADFVMRSALTQAARAMHRIYCENTDAPQWEQLSEFLRQSNIAAADHLLTKIRLLLQDPGISSVTAETCAAAFAVYQRSDAKQQTLYRCLEHRRWMRFHSMYNWQYGPIRNNALRIHPMMRPFEALTEAEQQKDNYAWELLGRFAERSDLF